MRASNEGMHSHDLDLIAAYAEGGLHDETEARLLVETCGECREEFAAQQKARSALAAAPLPMMTETEHAALRRDLWTELRSSHRAEKARTPWWYRAGYAAAGLLIVVGIGAVAARMGGFAGSDAAQTFDESGSALDGGGEGDAAEDAVSTTAAASATTGAPAAESPEASVDRGLSSAGIDFAAVAKEIRSQSPSIDFYRDDELAQLDTEFTECVDQAELADQQLVALVDGYFVTAPASDPQEDLTRLTFVDRAACTVAAVEE